MPKSRTRSQRVVSIAKVYANYNQEQGKEYYDYENYTIKWADAKRSEHYSIVQKLGRGKYSEVFEGFDSQDNRKIVIKILKPVRVSKIRREIKILQTLAGGPNIVRLLDVCKPVSPAFGGGSSPWASALVFEHIEHEANIKKAMLSLNDYEIRFFMYQLVKALQYCHSRGVIHRDVKPGNVVIDKKRRRLRLIDWGLADFYHPKQIYNVRVASRHYKSPELLVNMQMYDYSCDLFAFGLTVMGVVLQKSPFFRGADNIDQLYKLADVLGTIDLKKYIAKYSLKPSKEFNRLLELDAPRVDLSSFHDRRKRRQVDPNWHSKDPHHPHKRRNPDVDPWEITKDCGVYDLLERVLLYDHQERLTAQECMEHRFFAGIREEEMRAQTASQSKVPQQATAGDPPNPQATSSASHIANPRGQQVDGERKSDGECNDVDMQQAAPAEGQ